MVLGSPGWSKGYTSPSSICSRNLLMRRQCLMGVCSCKWKETPLSLRQALGGYMLRKQCDSWPRGRKATCVDVGLLEMGISRAQQEPGVQTS